MRLLQHLSFAGLLAVTASGCAARGEQESDLTDRPELAAEGDGIGIGGGDPMTDTQEVCDCLDNDHDGLVDEGLACKYNVTFKTTADDAFDLYVDGTLVAGGSSWQVLTTTGVALSSGYHDVRIEACDLYAVQAGLLATIAVPGQPPAQYDTGTNVWDISSSACPPPVSLPPPSFSPYLATAASVAAWNTTHGTTAQWVWNANSSQPGNYPQNCARTAINVCPQACRGECIDGGYCDNMACCIVPGDCVCYEPTHPISIAMCGDRHAEAGDGKAFAGPHCPGGGNPWPPE